ncbi:hypothetical protein [Streptomyces chrestomyceticus]|uniref:hypothetical protein n=1 Tax=Streptomyces chrestomyceticus TaxID=68185 RepID=UPI0037927138
MDAPDQPITSYAPPARRRGFIKAMHQIAADRGGGPVRVYFSTPPGLSDRPNWTRRLSILQRQLPDGVELLHYETAFDPVGDYFAQWPPLAATLDGLVLTGRRREERRTREHTLGPVARQELITMVSAGRPVLLHSMEHGLVPVLDCRPKRVGQEPRQRLRLTIPRGWSPSEPTLQAALHALGAEPAEKTGEVEPVKPAHLTHPFAAPPLAP